MLTNTSIILMKEDKTMIEYNNKKENNNNINNNREKNHVKTSIEPYMESNTSRCKYSDLSLPFVYLSFIRMVFIIILTLYKHTIQPTSLLALAK